jgi:CubicO group peptidase (beta-lactamase class C family)
MIAGAVDPTPSRAARFLAALAVSACLSTGGALAQETQGVAPAPDPHATKAGHDAFFAAGHKSQLIYVVPELDLVVAVAAESIPGGSVGFVNDLVLPAEAELAPSAPCVARIEQALPE